MAWQMACQSSSTSGGSHLLCPTFVVSMKERTTPFSCARKVSSPAPARSHKSMQLKQIRVRRKLSVTVCCSVTCTTTLMKSVMTQTATSEKCVFLLPALLPQIGPQTSVSKKKKRPESHVSVLCWPARGNRLTQGPHAQTNGATAKPNGERAGRSESDRKLPDSVWTLPQRPRDAGLSYKSP